MDGAAPYITFDHVDVHYNDMVAGLREVSLKVKKGEFVFLCGQTGSGKSTLIKVITRQVPHTSGRVILNQRDLGTVAPPDVPFLRREMGIVPQDFGLLPNKKIWENVGYAMRAVGRTKKEVRKLVPEILERVNILHRADAYPRELSQGEQQRVAIARALINNPPLLLADEPTANLDPSHSVEIMELLTQLNERGTTVLVATHDMPIVQQFAKRIVKLEFGRIFSDSSDPSVGLSREPRAEAEPVPQPAQEYEEEVFESEEDQPSV